MKKQKIYLLLIIMSSFTLFSFQCTEKGAVDGDEDGPNITVLKPQEGSQFYIDGGGNAPDWLLVYATATDDSDIKIATVTIFNNAGEEIYYDEVLPSGSNSFRVHYIQSTFRTVEPVNYRIEIEFIDVLGNSSKIIRNAVCLVSEIGGGEN
jgi:hypothetical protein